MFRYVTNLNVGNITYGVVLALFAPSAQSDMRRE